MKKQFCIISVILLVTVAAFATPFIVADPQTAEKYRIRLSADNGTTWGTWVEGAPVSGAMKFDIAGTAAGAYKGEAQAGGNVTVIDSTTNVSSTVWQWSASSPFTLTVKAGQKAVNIRIIE